MAFICPFACSIVAPGRSRAIIELNFVAARCPSSGPA
jgi:hypothetical protein